jgi:hypothetical protein
VLTLATLHCRCREDGDCLIWTQGTTGPGYPCAFLGPGIQGRNVRRWVLAAHGHDIEGKRVVSTCRTHRCVAVEHLRAMSPKEAGAFMGSSGALSTPRVQVARTKSARARAATKLTIVKAREMRALREGGMSLPKLAATFGVSPDTTWKVVRNISWRESARNSSVFNQVA